MIKQTPASKILADKFREDSREAISALAKRLYAKHHGGLLPWEGDIDPDADMEFHQNLDSPVSILVEVESCEDIVLEKDFITRIHFDVDNEWFETSDHDEMEYEDLNLDDLHNLHAALEKALTR